MAAGFRNAACELENSTNPADLNPVEPCHLSNRPGLTSRMRYLSPGPSSPTASAERSTKYGLAGLSAAGVLGSGLPNLPTLRPRSGESEARRARSSNAHLVEGNDESLVTLDTRS